MSKLTNTIRTEVDEDYFMDIADFRDYARSMMFPDPVGIDMSDELNDMVTEARTAEKRLWKIPSRNWSNATPKVVSTILTAMGLTVFDMVRSFCASAIPKLPPSVLAKSRTGKGRTFHSLVV